MTSWQTSWYAARACPLRPAKKLVGRLVLLAHEEHIPCEAIGRDLLHRAGLEALGVEVDMPEELLRACSGSRPECGTPQPYRRPQSCTCG